MATKRQAPTEQNWFDQAMEGRNNAWLAERLHVNRSTVLRWRKGDRRAAGLPSDVEARIRELLKLPRAEE